MSWVFLWGAVFSTFYAYAKRCEYYSDVEIFYGQRHRDAQEASRRETKSLLQKRAIELHDSEVVGLCAIGPQLFVFLRAYIHQFDEETMTPGSTGWIQAIALCFHDGVQEGDVDEFPANIWSGQLVCSDETFKLIPIPFPVDGPSSLSLHIETNETLTFRGSGVTLIPLGEPQFVEDTDYERRLGA